MFVQLVIYVVNVSLNGVTKKICPGYWTRTGEISPVLVLTIDNVIGESFH